MFDYPPVRVPTDMDRLKKSFLFHPKYLVREEYVHLPVRMSNPGILNNLISAFRLIFAMNKVCDIVSRGIESSFKSGTLSRTTSDTCSIPLIFAFILTASNLNIVAKSECKSFDERMIEIHILHDALQSKTTTPIESMNVTNNIHLIMKSLSDELHLIVPNVSKDFKDLFRYEQFDEMHCKTCFVTRTQTRTQQDNPTFLNIKLNYLIEFDANVFDDLSIKPQTFGDDSEYEMYHIEDIITLHNRKWGYVSNNNQCSHAIECGSRRKACVVSHGNQQKFSSTFLDIEIDRSDEKKSLKHRNEYGVLIPPLFKLYDGSEIEIEYKHLAAIIDEEPNDKDLGATTSIELISLL